MTPILLALIFGLLIYYGFKFDDMLANQLETARLLESSIKMLHQNLEPQFTCYYCNNKFPMSTRVQIDKYSYCQEHANRGNSS